LPKASNLDGVCVSSCRAIEEKSDPQAPLTQITNQNQIDHIYSRS